VPCDGACDVFEDSVLRFGSDVSSARRGRPEGNGILAQRSGGMDAGVNHSRIWFQRPAGKARHGENRYVLLANRDGKFRALRDRQKHAERDPDDSRCCGRSPFCSYRHIKLHTVCVRHKSTSTTPLNSILESADPNLASAGGGSAIALQEAGLIVFGISPTSLSAITLTLDPGRYRSGSVA
jgi:hypothetical protein